MIGFGLRCFCCLSCMELVASMNIVGTTDLLVYYEMKTTRRSKTKDSTLDDFIEKPTNKKLKNEDSNKNNDDMLLAKGTCQREVAKTIARRLGDGSHSPVFLTKDGQSWYIHVKKYKPTPDRDAFSAQWDLHPKDFHPLTLFGKTVYESRYSQSWGVSYAYSGSVSKARDYKHDADGEMVQSLIDEMNELVSDIFVVGNDAPYNGCLQNWYLPEHKIGLHSDDEKALQKEFPIFSLSWGGPRRFLFRARDNRKDIQELLLEDGDLLVMGGTCQQTHKHEVPKLRTTLDPIASPRINWTIRAFAKE